MFCFGLGVVCENRKSMGGLYGHMSHGYPHVSFQPELDFVKPGTAKRMRGQWMKSARLLESEHQTYVTRKSTRDRPPPSVDLWELFAGRALCSELAHQYDLEALQPWDLVYGQDFMSTSTRRVAFKTWTTFVRCF